MLARTYAGLGRQAEAAKLGEETLALQRTKLGSYHPDTLWRMHDLANSYAALDRYAEAVKLYERALRRGENYQVVILDATVRGGMGGVATIERLRGMDPNVNAIICSGYSDEAALSEFLAYGFRGALPKPFTRSELADALQRSFETANVN